MVSLTHLSRHCYRGVRVSEVLWPIFAQPPCLCGVPLKEKMIVIYCVQFCFSCGNNISKSLSRSMTNPDGFVVDEQRHVVSATPIQPTRSRVRFENRPPHAPASETVSWLSWILWKKMIYPNTFFSHRKPPTKPPHRACQRSHVCCAVVPVQCHVVRRM